MPYQTPDFIKDAAHFYRLFVLIILACATTIVVVLGYVPLVNALLLIPFALGLCYLARDNLNKILFPLVLVTTTSIGFFVAIYRPDGFNYPLIWRADSLYPGGGQFSLYLNLSKALGGYLVILWLAKGVFKNDLATYPNVPKHQLVLIVCGAITTILIAANTIFGVSWSPKLPDGIAYFVVVNLFVTVISEEAFFRLLLQEQIKRCFRNTGVGLWVSVVVATVLFALAHAAPMGPTFGLFLLAGFVYALVYARTKSFSISVIMHFGVNILHFTLLEYPL